MGIGGYITTTNDASNQTVYTLATSSSIAYTIQFVLTGYCTASTGGHVDFSYSQNTLSRARNAAGTIALGLYYGNSFNSDSGLTGVVGQNITNSGTNILIQLHGASTDTWRWSYYIKIYKNN